MKYSVILLAVLLVFIVGVVAKIIVILAPFMALAMVVGLILFFCKGDKDSPE